MLTAGLFVARYYQFKWGFLYKTSSVDNGNGVAVSFNYING